MVVVMMTLSVAATQNPLLAQTTAGPSPISQLVLFGITIVAIVAAAIITVVLTKRQD